MYASSSLRSMNYQCRIENVERSLNPCKQKVKTERQLPSSFRSLASPNKIRTKTQRGVRKLCVSIRPSPIDGEGLFATCTFRLGDTICRSKGYIVDSRNRYLEPWESRISYQLNENLHFVPTSIVAARLNGLAKVNHSCNPNSYVQFNPRNRYLVLRALRNISEGEEITCDYCATETELAHPFLCRCGENVCRRFIRGATI